MDGFSSFKIVGSTCQVLDPEMLMEKEFCILGLVQREERGSRLDGLQVKDALAAVLFSISKNLKPQRGTPEPGVQEVKTSEHTGVHIPCNAAQGVGLHGRIQRRCHTMVFRDSKRLLNVPAF